MKLLFVRSQLLGSRLIRWGLEEECSYFAICFDDQAKGSGIVFESKASGAELSWFGHFKKTHYLIHALSFNEPMDLEAEESIYQSILAQYSGQGYDWRALGYWVLQVIGHRLLKLPISRQNAWQQAGYNLCTGLAAGVPWIAGWAQESFIDLEMIGPESLYQRLLSTGQFNDERIWCALQNQP